MANTPQWTTETHEIATSIAAQLGETAQGPLVQIRRIVFRLGVDVARALLDETLQVEARGGMLLPDGSRRRTPGGVYFHLTRGRVSDEDRIFIFPPRTWGKRKQAAPKARTPAQPPLDPAILPNLTGDVQTVKITLIGRPGPTKMTRDGSVMTSMQNTKAPSFPKGLPAPPTAPTIYTVYIAPKQWNRVAEALKNPEDALIVEGWPTYDPALEGIAVYVTNATTKVLQQEKRTQG